MVICYDAPSHKGIDVNGWQEALNETWGFNVVISVYRPGPEVKNQLKAQRQHWLRYFTSLKKGKYVDLDPDKSANWIGDTPLEEAQFKSLNKLLGQSMSLPESINLICDRKLGVPSTCQQLAIQFQEKRDKHKELLRENIRQWHKEFYEALPAYQMLVLIETKLSKKGRYAEFKGYIEGKMAEQFRGWTRWQFLVAGLNSECTCFDNMDEEDALNEELEELIRPTKIKKNDEDVKQDEPHLSGMSRREIRRLVERSSLYHNFKRVEKYRNFKESEKRLLEKLGTHLERIFVKKKVL